MHLPLWRTQRPRRPAPPKAEGGLACVASTAGAWRIAACDLRAADRGVAPGQTLADARALAPDLTCIPHDPAGDEAMLRRLARWCGRYGPAVTPAPADPGAALPADGVFADIAGVEHLFGGPEGLLRDVTARLSGFGLMSAAAIADTPGAAFALATCGAGGVSPPHHGIAPLADLPVAALRLCAREAEALRAVGLKRIADLARLPRASVARRFGRGVLERLDAALGAAPDALATLQPPPQAAARAVFAEPFTTLEALQQAAEDLLAQTAARLFALGLGAHGLRLRLFRVDGRVVEIAVRAGAPIQAQARWRRLLRERLERAAERLDLGFGVDAAVLAAEGLAAMEPVGGARADLDPEAARRAAADAAARDLAERLSARFGEESVFRLAPRNAWLPEAAQVPIGAHARVKREAAEGDWGDLARERPPFLLARPEPIEALAAAPDSPPAQFRWRRVLHRVRRGEGPERLAPAWWNRAAPTRDYYRVETTEGRRLWVFRAGLYERETDAPDWFVHGAWP